MGDTRTVYIGSNFEAELGKATQYPVSAPSLENHPICHDVSRCYQFYVPFVSVDDGSTPTGMLSGNFGDTHFHTHPQSPNQASITWRLYYNAGGQRIGLRVKTSAADNLYYLLADHLGSISVTVDAKTGAVYSEMVYEAWGKARETSGAAMPTARRFTGQVEGEIGLYYYGARWYDPILHSGPNLTQLYKILTTL